MKRKDQKDAVHQPHDAAFKNTFSNKEAMLDFLAANLAPELFKKIDQENLELTNKGIYRSFNQWFIDRINLIVDFLEKDYISYANEAFLYMLKVDDDSDLLEIIKKSNKRSETVFPNHL